MVQGPPAEVGAIIKDGAENLSLLFGLVRLALPSQLIRPYLEFVMRLDNEVNSCAAHSKVSEIH